jgi:phosphatidylglycerophosphate synthase
MAVTVPSSAVPRHSIRMTVGRISTASGDEGRGADGLSPWLSRHAAAMLIAVAVTVVLPSGVWVALAALASFVELGCRERTRLAAFRPYGGYANQLTALRLALLLTAAAFMGELPDAWLWLLLAANVAVDVVDGRVARRTQQVSPFGAVLDREVDAVFVLVAYLYFFVVVGLPAWVLIPGLLPYAYRLYTLTRPSRPAPEHRERLAPFLAGANFVVLLVAVGAPADLQLRVVLLSAALVGVSFTVSFVNLYLDEYSAS